VVFVAETTTVGLVVERHGCSVVVVIEPVTGVVLGGWDAGRVVIGGGVLDDWVVGRVVMGSEGWVVGRVVIGSWVVGRVVIGGVVVGRMVVGGWVDNLSIAFIVPGVCGRGAEAVL
jgi:hypothetical protein